MESTSPLLENQVGGHPGVRASKDGSQIIKPCLPTERLFYQKVISSNIKGFEALRKHVPAFYGVVPAEGPEDKDEYRAWKYIYLYILTHALNYRPSSWKTSPTLLLILASSTSSLVPFSTMIPPVQRKRKG
jgi:hypothetical protein